MEKDINKLLDSEWMLPIKRCFRELEAQGHGEEVKRKLKAWQAMLDEDCILLEKKGAVGIITFNSPHRNNELLTPWYGLVPAATRELANDDDIRVVLITGKGSHFSVGAYPGPEGFSAGMDVSNKGNWPEGMRRTFREMSQGPISSVYSIGKPTIVALNGPAFAEGPEIALAADIRIGHKNSDFCFSHCWLGHSPYGGAFWLLPRVVGIGKASEYLLTSRRISGEEAYRVGLLNYLVSEETLWEEAFALAQKMARLPPIAARLIKIQLRKSQTMFDFDTALEFGAIIDPILQATEDHMDAEGYVAGKRKVMDKLDLGTIMSETEERVAKGR